jgi:hypothetical protein
MKDVTCQSKSISLDVSVLLPFFGGILGKFALCVHHFQLSIHDIGWLVLQHPILSSLDSLGLLIASYVAEAFSSLVGFFEQCVLLDWAGYYWGW